MKMTGNISIPNEVWSRFIDVSYECPSRWAACSEEQKARVIEECNHVLGLIADGDCYEGLERYSIGKSCKVFLAKVAILR